MKHCIFYLPYELDPSAARARMVRPRKMIQAFRSIGYDVFEITGNASERKARIKKCRHQIASGVQFDFMYSEASTMPTLLTEPHHLPTHPFMDFGFFKYVKKQGIPIGLFYPDIYWKFDSYGEHLPAWKRFFALKNYALDIHEYEKYLDRFYIPSLQVCDYLQSSRLSEIAEELPPGADNLVIEPKRYENRDFAKDPLTVFYVGGLGNHYQIGELIAAISQTPNTRLILCCREAEWQVEKPNLENLLSERIEVIHKSGVELEPYYQQADLCSLMFKKDIYMGMAKPVKAYEYLAHEKPVLATKGTGIGEYVEETGIGWTIEYSASAISKQLKEICVSTFALQEKACLCTKEKNNNTWENRAKQAAKGLTLTTSEIRGGIRQEIADARKDESCTLRNILEKSGGLLMSEDTKMRRRTFQKFFPLCSVDLTSLPNIL